MDIQHAEKLAEVDARSKSNTHRLDKLEPLVSEIHALSETLVGLTMEMKYTNSAVADIKKELEEINKIPANRWNEATKSLIGACLGVLGTALGGGIIYLLTLGR